MPGAAGAEPGRPLEPSPWPPADRCGEHFRHPPGQLGAQVLAQDELAPGAPHGAQPPGIRAQGADRRRERGRILGRDDHPAARPLDQRPGLARHAADDRHARAHDLEEFGRQDLPEHRQVPQRDDADVRGAVEPHQRGARLLPQEGDVGQAHRGRAPLQRLALCAVPREQEVHVRLATQRVRRLEQRPQAVRHAVRTEVRDHELPLEPVPGPHRLPVLHRLIQERRVDPVGHVCNALIGDAGLVQVRTEPLRDDHHARRAPVQVALEREERPQEQAAAQRPQLHRGLRPDVPQLEDERHAVHPAEQVGRDRGEELGRGPHHHIGPGAVDPAEHDGRAEERQEAQHPPTEPAVRRGVEPRPDDLDALHLLAAQPLPAVARVDDPARVVREPRDHRHLVAAPDPLPCVLERANRRSVGLRREVLTHHRDLHPDPSSRSWSCSRDQGSPARSPPATAIATRGAGDNAGTAP